MNHFETAPRRVDNGHDLINMLGQRVGWLEVTRPASKEEKASALSKLTRNSGAFWVCICHRCGNDHYVAHGGTLRFRQRRGKGQIACGCIPRGCGGTSTHKYKEFESVAAAVLYDNARYRARKKGILFELAPADITIPDRCPLLPWLRLQAGREKMSDASPTLDRIDSKSGYIKGNVWVISWKANRLKSDAEPEELFALARNLSRALATHPPNA